MLWEVNPVAGHCFIARCGHDVACSTPASVMLIIVTNKDVYILLLKLFWGVERKLLVSMFKVLIVTRAPDKKV